MNPAIRSLGADDDAGIEAYLRIRNASQPDNPDSRDHLEWEEATYPHEGTLLLAEAPDGTAVGAASSGRIYMYPREYERAWLGLWVASPARRRGVGTALLAAAGEAARAAGKTGFETELSEAYEAGHAFLAVHGFVEVERSKSVALDLAGRTAPVAGPPSGIAIVTLADRPDLLPGLHGVAIEAYPDIPSADEPIDAGSLEAFVARDIDRPGIPRDAAMVAVDDATGEVAGFATLMYVPGSRTIAWHDMTVVRPAWRGRGIATALKRATIGWAIANRVERLETGNDESNAPMRAVNAALGYRPMPDVIALQGPLPPPR